MKAEGFEPPTDKTIEFTAQHQTRLGFTFLINPRHVPVPKLYFDLTQINP